MIKNNIYFEKKKMDEYVIELREQIKFLKGELLFENTVIMNLLSKIGDKS